MNKAAISPPGGLKDVNFNDYTSTFFQHHDQLPSPDEVRSQAHAQYLSGTFWGKKTKRVNPGGYNFHPVPAVFDFKDISVFVKWGSDVQLTEGQCLYAIRRTFGDSVPVPEVYGWCKDGDEMFLYMEVKHRKTLEAMWPELQEDDKMRICGELRTILQNLRQFKQDPSNTFIGSITKGNYYERALWEESKPECGPFASVKDFHDWFIQQYKRRVHDPDTIPEPYREHLPDDSEIVFTHGDLHRSNIIVSATSPRVVALIDWEQSAAVS